MGIKYEIIVHSDDSGDSINGNGPIGIGFAGGFISGHMYVELQTTDTATGKIIQDVFAGKGRTLPITPSDIGNLSKPVDGFIGDSRERYNSTVVGSPNYDPTINHFSHSAEITKEGFDKAIARINTFREYSASNIDDYTIVGGDGLSGNCVDFVQSIFMSSGLSGSVASLFSTSELLQSKFAGIYALIQEDIYPNCVTTSTFLLSTANILLTKIASGAFIGNLAVNAYHEFLFAIGWSQWVDPLVIDLNGDGIKLDSWQASNALFDLTGDGTKENTGWTKANGDDAFLVIDKNNDGKINDITEMFGNASTPGFRQLSTYDSNKDNLINSTDTQFSLLKLWNDKDADGVVIPVLDTGSRAANDNVANDNLAIEKQLIYAIA